MIVTTWSSRSTWPCRCWLAPREPITTMCRTRRSMRDYLSTLVSMFKEGLYRIWYGVNRLGDNGVHTLGDTSAFVNLASQLLLTRRGKTRMDGVGIVFEFYIDPL